MGEIRSLNYKRTGKTKVLKPAINKDGYCATMLQRDDKKYCSWKIHRWIALTFLGPRPDGLQVNHKDGNKQNNAVENLEYITHSENVQHSFDTGLQKPKRGTMNGQAKITENDVREIRAYAKENGPYYGRDELAQKYGISSAHVKDIVNRRRDIWPHV